MKEDIAVEPKAKKQTAKPYLLQLMLDNTDDCIWAVDSNLRVIAANTNYRNCVFQLTGKNLKAGDPAVLRNMPENYTDLFTSYYQNALRGKAFTTRAGFISGSPFSEAELSFKPVYDGKKIIAVICNAAKNITHKIAPPTRQAGQDIDDSSNQLEILLDNTEGSFILLNTDLNIVNFNKQAAYNSKTYINIELRKGLSIFKLAQAKNIPALKAMYKKILGGETSQTETRVKLKGKKEIIFKNGIKPLINKQGQITGVFINSIDITEARGAKQELERSEKYFRSLIENSAEAIVLTDVKGKVLYQSPSTKRISGYTLAEMQKLNGANLIHPEDRADDLAFFEKLLQSPGTSMAHNHRLRHKKGHYLYLEGTYTNLLNDENVQAIVYTYHDATEKTNLQNRQSLLAAIVNSSEDAIISKVLDGTITSWNSGAEKIFGYKAKNAIGKNMLILFPPDRVNEEIEITEQIKSGKNLKLYQTVWLKKDKTPVDISLTVSPIKDAAGNIIGTSNIARNITDRKKAEQIINEERTKLKLIIENMSTGVVVCDTAGNFTMFNQTAKKILGMGAVASKPGKRSQTYGFYYLDKVSPFPSDKLPLSLAVKGIKSTALILYVKNNNLPEGRYISISGGPIIDKSGNITAGVSVFRDVTEIIVANEKLQESLNKLKAASEIQSSILDALPANIALLDKNGVIIDVNDSWRTFGEKNKSHQNNYFVGSNYIELSENTTGPDSESGRKIAKGIKEVIAGKLTSFEMEYQCQTEEEVKWFKAEVSPLMKKGLSGAVVMHMDITDRKQIELEVQRLNENLESKVRERTEELESFAYSVSHDLRAPLRIINGFAHILEEDYGNMFDQKGTHLLHHITASAKRMDLLITDLLKLSNLGKVEMVKRLTDMFELAHVIVEEQKLINDSSIKPQIKLNKLPPALADAGLIKQVWANLISNAIKYSGKNPQPNVEIGSLQKNGKTVYFVKDNGTGFDMAYANKLFKVFQRLHASDEYEGTGVGLVIVSRIINRHGGKIWAEAEPGKGATFYFTLH